MQNANLVYLPKAASRSDAGQWVERISYEPSRTWRMGLYDKSGELFHELTVTAALRLVLPQVFLSGFFHERGMLRGAFQFFWTPETGLTCGQATPGFEFPEILQESVARLALSVWDQSAIDRTAESISRKRA